MRQRWLALLARIEDSKWAPLLQFMKFAAVGVSNTIISYGVEMICFYVLFASVAWADEVRITVSSIIAFVISVTNSYYWNNRFVFKKSANKKSSPK